MNEKKCNGYESNYTFLSKEDFLKHLKNCSECRQEHEKMQKVSSLLQEAKPYINEKKKKTRILKAACAVFVVFFSCMTLPLFTLGTNVYENIAAHTQQNVLTAEEMGLPVDEYGFIYIN